MAKVPRCSVHGPRLAGLFIEPDAQAAAFLAQITFASRVHNMRMFRVASVNFGDVFCDEILVFHWMQGQVNARHLRNFACP